MARGRTGNGYVANAQRRLAIQKARLQGAASRTGRGKGRGKAAMPWDSQAQRESAELGANSSDARASIAANYAQAQNELGFGSGAANPYSATAENKKALTVDQRGIGTTAGNNLYAGSTLNAQSQARGAYDKTQTGIEDEISRAQGDYTGDLAKNARDESLGKTGIKEGALERAAATEPAPLGVGKRGRGRLNGVREGTNVRRPAAARQANKEARTINKRLSGGKTGRGRAGVSY
jgi:hypothetical protein